MSSHTNFGAATFSVYRAIVRPIPNRFPLPSFVHPSKSILSIIRPAHTHRHTHTYTAMQRAMTVSNLVRGTPSFAEARLILSIEMGDHNETNKHRMEIVTMTRKVSPGKKVRRECPAIDRVPKHRATSPTTMTTGHAVSGLRWPMMRKATRMKEMKRKRKRKGEEVVIKMRCVP